MGPRLHGCLERIPADHLMDMGRHHNPRVNEGIQTLYCQLRTGETHHLLGHRALREEPDGENFPLHRGQVPSYAPTRPIEKVF